MVSTVKHSAFSRKIDLPSLKVMALTSEEGKNKPNSCSCVYVRALFTNAQQ